MSKTEVEISAKTIDEAIVAGCAELGVGIDEVDFEIVDQGGIFRKMKVKVMLKPEDKEPVAAAQDTGALPLEVFHDTPKARPAAGKENGLAVDTSDRASAAVHTAEEAAPKAAPKKQGARGKADEAETHKVVKGKADEFVIEGKERAPRKPREERPVTEFDETAPKFVKSLEFATALFKLLDDSLTVTTSHNDREFVIEVHGENVSRLIGKEGHTMAAINTLVSSVAINHANGEGRRCVVDIENYREKRRQSLVELAKRKAEWVRESGRTIKLEPMPARERVIIHTALQDVEGIETHSVGDEPHRCLVISPGAR